MRDGVKLSVQLTHGDRLRVDDSIIHLVLGHLLRRTEVAERLCQHLVRARLTCEWLADDHQTVTNEDHLIHLDTGTHTSTTN